MKSYRFLIRYGGYFIDHTFKSENDEKASEDIVTEILSGRGSWGDERDLEPSKIFITYEEVNANE